MAIEVKLFANFREIVGERIVTGYGETVDELLENLIERNSDLKDEIFDDYESKKTKNYVNILVNGRKIDFLDGMETKLEDEDTVAIFPPVAGG